MRGGLFHNWMGYQTAEIFEAHGFTIKMESPVKLPDGSTTVIDVLASDGNRRIGCEIETTPRHAIDNALRGASAEIDIWTVVPNRCVQRQILRRFASSDAANGMDFRVLLLGQLHEALLDSVSYSKGRVISLEW